MSKNTHMKPCPFCGKSKIFIANTHETLSANMDVFLLCESCGARGPLVEAPRCDGVTDVIISSVIHWWETRQDTVK